MPNLMIPSRWKFPALWLTLWAASLAGCKKCSPTAADEETFRVEAIGVELPRLGGWKREAIEAPEDLAKGGLLMRLVVETAEVGAPRIEVWLEPLGTRPTNLEDFLASNLRAMSDYEAAGSVKITDVVQRAIKVGPRKAYRVRHEYALKGKDGSLQSSITQVSTFWVLDGRGITVTASGQTELFHPRAPEVNTILDGLATTKPTPPATEEQPAGEDKDEEKETPQPIDLGKLGNEPAQKSDDN